ncbi:DinB family protein [Nonomuraea sp. SBT364]|uniref:DinB family protein n=1 Tax=Nonomuraea sp. SBT364 TaxID=1580530 RepID=UPI0007C6864B|nr:DinB family protein [Nonomuraea sp. SBT364]
MTELDRLRWQLGVSWSLLTLHLDQVTDREALWEPGPDCWTVRPQPDGTWAADFAMEEPDPIPVPTIGWVMWHIGFWWTRTYTSCFGEPGGGAPDWGSAAAATPWPGGAAAAVTWLTGCHDRWLGALESLSPADLDSAERSGWFADGTHSLGHVAAWVNVELMKNAAEIGNLRLLHPR